MLTVSLPTNWTSHRKWITKTLLNRFNIPIQFKTTNKPFWQISHSNHKESILLPDIFFNKASNTSSLFSVKPHDPCSFIRYINEGIYSRTPILFGLNNQTEIPTPTPNKNYTLNIDIFGSAFWIMTRLEEFQSNERDIHDRYSAYSSHAWRNNYILNPVVDEWMIILGSLMKQLWPTVKMQHGKFSQSISHDIDDPFMHYFMPTIKALKLISANSIKAHSPSMTIKLTSNYLISKLGIRTKDPCDTFDWLMDESEKNNIKSSFYFIAALKKSPFDSDYDIFHPMMLNLIKLINLRNHELGIHPSYRTYKNSELMKNEVTIFRNALDKASVDQIAIGGRMHYLRWHHSYTPQTQIKAGLSYDSTLGYADHPGFRCGTCYEFNYFNLDLSCETNLVIKPLVAMECTVMAKRYMNLGATEEAYLLFRTLKEQCKNVGGNFNLLWHNSYFFNPDERYIYSSLLKD